MKISTESNNLSEHTTNDSNSSKDESILKFKQTSITSNIISFISSYLLENIIQNRNSRTKRKPTSNDVLYSKRFPKLSIEDFLKRVVKYTKMELSTLVCVFIYLNNFLTKEGDFVLCSCNVYRLILGIAVLSVKYHEDFAFNNSYYSRIGGLKAEELNAIEYGIFERLGYEMFITHEQYQWTLERILDC